MGLYRPTNSSTKHSFLALQKLKVLQRLSYFPLKRSLQSVSTAYSMKNDKIGLMIRLPFEMTKLI